jgi:hypothetical protein
MVHRELTLSEEPCPSTVAAGAKMAARWFEVGPRCWRIPGSQRRRKPSERCVARLPRGGCPPLAIGLVQVDPTLARRTERQVGGPNFVAYRPRRQAAALEVVVIFARQRDVGPARRQREARIQTAPRGVERGTLQAPLLLAAAQEEVGAEASDQCQSDQTPEKTPKSAFGACDGSTTALASAWPMNRDLRDPVRAFRE